MRVFAELYTRLDSTTKTNKKLAALQDYFGTAQPADAAWAIYFLIGRKPKRLVLTRNLRTWAAELAGLPDWLFEESYGAVGDLAETIALLLPAPATSSERPLHEWVEQQLLPLREQDEQGQRLALQQAWREMSPPQRFVWNKLLTGAFRVGVSQRMVTRALAQVSGLEAAVVAHRLMGHWKPTPDFVEQLLAPETGDHDISKPYPFYLAYPLEDPPNTLGPIEKWLAEWKWDGIRAQLIRRKGETFLWSRGEELIVEKYPEIIQAAPFLKDGTVLDGEIVAWKDGAVLPFGQLQRRIGRKSVGKKLLQEIPARFIAFDLLECSGEDVRKWPLQQRRQKLGEILAPSSLTVPIALSELISARTWEELEARRASSRSRGVEGVMLKSLASAYGVGRERGSWWKWKVEPYVVDAVMIYAQLGHGRRASLFTDYTFAVWNGDELVPIAKAYSGLSDAEIREVDRFVRRNTIERFGPVRRVKPELVFELAFESIQRSTRHKSGIAVRFPRMARWRRDKPAAEADSLDTLKALMPTNQEA